jgi:hypothetical protein
MHESVLGESAGLWREAAELKSTIEPFELRVKVLLNALEEPQRTAKR